VARTFEQARAEILTYLAAHRWTVKLRSSTGQPLKIPHATSPGGELRLWFKAQAVHFTEGNRHDVGDALSLHTDIRTITGEQLVAALQKWKPDALPGEFAMAKGKKVSDVRNMDQLAKMFGLPDSESVIERNEQYIHEVADEANEGDDESIMDAQERAEREVYEKWHAAVQHAADVLFDKHDLELAPIYRDKKKLDYPYEYRVTPRHSWPDAADKIRETINGVGMFQFDTLKEFLDSGPYTAREAVLSHLAYIKDYAEVYGSTSAARLYERAF
jgi:hypothetical protein